MIYLILSPAFKVKSGRVEYEKLLKIGWAEDKNWSRRKLTYKSHNPTSQVLKVFPRYNIEVEQALHSKFSIHRYPGTSEWYYYCDDILNFFNSPDIDIELKKMIVKGKELKEERGWKKRIEVLKYILLLINPLTNNISFSDITSEDEFSSNVKSIYSEQIYKEFQKKLFNFSLLSPLIRDIVLRLIFLSKYSRVEELKNIMGSLEDSEQEELLENWVDKETLQEYNKLWNL